MEKEIEERISEEIDIVNYKYQKRLEKIAENYQKALDEIENTPDETKKVLECLKGFIFQQKNCLNDFLIDIKEIQREYEKFLDSEN